MFASWQRWKDRRVLARRAIPDELWGSTLAQFPFLRSLGPADAAQLRKLSTLFLDRKQFEGIRGLQVTDAMAVTIAAQACLPILHLGLHWYDAFVGIVVHESEVVATRERMDDAGVVHHYREHLTGEAMEGGPVTLSWQDVADAGQTAEWGYNVVIHECAHVLDMRNGEADGIPPLHGRDARIAWERSLATHYEAFCRRVDAGQDTFLDPYGAEAPGEFFAVACEAFFVAPLDFHAEHPDFYAQLKMFFQQDPASHHANRKPRQENGALRPRA